MCSGDAGFDATGSASPTLFLFQPMLELLRLSCPATLAANTASNAVPGAAQYADTSAFVICRAEVKTTWQNVNNFKVYYECYYCRLREDLGTVNNTINQIANAGYTQEGGLMSTVSLGTTPFDNHLFTKTFKVYKVKKGMLEQGQRMQQKISSRKPKYIDINDYSYASSPLGSATYTIRHYGLKKHSKFIWYRFLGELGNNSSGAAAANITFGGPTLNFVTEHRYRVQSLMKPVPYNLILTSSSVTAGNVAILPIPATSFSFMSDDLDAAAVAATS